MGISIVDDISVPFEEPVPEHKKEETTTSTNQDESSRRIGKKPERESISKWFNNQFGGFFSDEDTEVK